MAELTADTVIILSSELIASVVEVYFNQEMFKMPVKIVDLKPSSDGYAFSLAFDTDKGDKNNIELCKHGENVMSCWQCEGLDSKSVKKASKASVNSSKRDNKGKFVKKKGLTTTEVALSYIKERDNG